MKRSLLQFLRCPQTKSKLTLKQAVDSGRQDEITTGELLSEEGQLYPIRNGVPIMLPPGGSDERQSKTAESFSEKWKRAPGYREDTKPHYIAWYLERYGHVTMEQLRSFLETKRFILDAGTGEGRDSELYARNSSAQVFGVDISEGIEIAYRDLGHLPNLHLIRADLTALPFAGGFFDFIACDQVIHHTADTYASLQALLRHLGKGHIAVYTYKKKGPIREFCDDYIRERTVPMAPEACMEFSEAMTKLGKALSDLKVEIHIPADIPLLEIKAGSYDLQRWIYWNVFKCYWNDSMDWTSNVITNFDWYHPLCAHRHTPEEVSGWFGEQGLSIEHMSVVESGISVLASNAVRPGIKN